VYLYTLALKFFQGEAIVSLVEKLVLKLVIHWLAMVAPWLMFRCCVIHVIGQNDGDKQCYWC